MVVNLFKIVQYLSFFNEAGILRRRLFSWSTLGERTNEKTLWSTLDERTNEKTIFLILHFTRKPLQCP